MSAARRILLMWVIFTVPATLFGAVASHGKKPHWEIKGDLSEACTCSVPCGCNFRSRPSHPYCWSIASLDIQKGHYGRVKLNGLHLVRSHGKEAVVWYIDDLATPAQAAALQKIAAHISAYLMRRRPSFVHFEKAHITQVVGNQSSVVRISGKGGFEADYIVGGDGKNPITVQNMTAWNVHHDIKAKTKRLHYKDPYGSQFDMAGTNANEGKFDWTDRARWYL